LIFGLEKLSSSLSLLKHAKLWLRRLTLLYAHFICGVYERYDEVLELKGMLLSVRNKITP